MPSIIEGYNYDIFISYRQKDNKGDRWVSQFVEALKTELESTFKEDISVYFDINPHDGLLETHDVDESLKEKLKCLIFIPIISRTYCDPESFAWEHEFKAFIEQAAKDQYGLKVRLPNGNVANRILPIQIHDLKAEDKLLFEKELGGLIRAIEFIYKEPGVNRPLTQKDSEDKNINRTNYRNQINKVANAIDEIISAMKVEPHHIVKETDKPKELIKAIREEDRRIDLEKPAKANKAKLISTLAIVAILIVAGIIAYPKIFRRDEDIIDADGRIPIAVMPFQNQTNDTTLQTMLQSSIITSLANNREEFKVRQIESVTGILQSKDYVNYASITPSIASKISQKLVANVFIIGSITQSGTTLRLNAQLVNSKTIETFKPFQLDGPEEDIMRLSDSLSAMISNFLMITVLKKEGPTYLYKNFVTTTSSEAYRHFTLGDNFFFKGDYESAINHYRAALDIDSTFIYAEIMISFAYSNQGLYNQAKVSCLRVYKERERVTDMLKILINALHASLFETPDETIKYWRELQTFDDQSPVFHEQIGFNYKILELYDQAIPEMGRSLEIYNSWNVKPLWAAIYDNLGYAYHETGQYKKEKKLYKKAEQDFPDNTGIIYRQAVLELSQGKTKTANEYIEKFKSIIKEQAANEADVATELAYIYSEAGILDKAEEYFRQALSFEPENPSRMNSLAYFLIDRDRNINEGLELEDRALKISPDNFSYLHWRGWGLYKSGKYDKALEILQKSWDLRLKNAIYNHTTFLHLEAAKKAVAEQKNN